MSRNAVTTHALLPAIAARWSPRAFATTPVSDTDLHAILEAGRWAASSYNDQPWSFIITRHGGPGHAAMLSALVAFNQGWVGAAPVLFFSVARTHFAQDGKPNKHAWHDCGAATAQMATEASARGMQMHGMAGYDPEAARAALGIPEGHDPVAAWALGFPGNAAQLPAVLAEREAAPRTRREPATLFYAGRFGTAM